jgi:streptogramin lyase
MTETHHSEVGRTHGRSRRVRPAKRGRRPCVELLESRQLLTTITEYGPLLTPPPSGQNVQPQNITVGSDGNLWFTEGAGNQIGMINPTAPTDTPTTFSHGLPALAGLDGITSGPNNDIWFTESGLGANAIGMINPSLPNTQTIQNFSGTPGHMMTANSSPSGIASADGYLWFTQPLSDQIGRLDPNTGQITEYQAPTAMADLDSKIILGPDGNLWFTEFGYIGIFSPKTDTLVKPIGVPLPGGSNEEPFGITVGPDGNIWYSEAVNNASFTGFVSFGVGSINTNAETLISPEIPVSAASEPFGITAGPDGNIWFTVSGNSHTAGTIDEISLSTRAVSQTISIPTNIVATPNPVAITRAPDGNLWFADGAGAIGVVDDTHLVVTSEPPLDVSVDSPFGITITDEYTSGVVDTAFHGNVKVALADNPGGSSLGGTVTLAAVDGVASFSGLTLNKPDNVNVYTLQATSNATNGPTPVTTSGFYVVVGPTTELVITTEPPSTVTAGNGFGITVEDEYVSAPNPVNTAFNGNVTIALDANPGPSSLGGTLTVAAVNGVATFSGLTLNNPGIGYTLQVSSTGLNPTTTVPPFNVALPIPPTIMAEQPVFFQKTNKKGKPVGKKLLIGYTITYSTAMNQSAIGTSTNYQVEVLKKFVKERVPGSKKKIKVPVYQQIAVTVPPPPTLTSMSATLMLPGKPGSQKFPKGGQITVIAAPPGGVDDSSGIFLAQNVVLTISAGGKTIS